MANTPRLVVPYIAENQAAKYLTHNEGLDAYDVLVMSNVKDRDLATPPGSPASGDAYIVASGGTGTWSGHDDDLAIYISAQWKFHTPVEGWFLYVQDENLFVYWDGAAWTVSSTSGTFLGLSDTPNSFTGQALKTVRVNAGETALEFATPAGGATDFTDLGDVPASYAGQTLKYVRVNAGETALEFAAGSVGAFEDLTDTFTFAGNSQKLVAVNVGETALEPVDPPGGVLGLARGALVKRTSDLSIATAVATKVAWQAEIYDTDAMWTVGTPTKIIVPSGVTKAIIFGQIRIDPISIPSLRLRVLKNNAIADGLPYLDLSVQNFLFSTEQYGIPFSSPPLVVTAGDELELEFYQDSGATVNIQSGEHSFFGVTLITDASLTVSDGDKGDITVSSSGTVWTIDAGAVTYAKMQDVSAASKLVGRGDSGSGDPQEITLGTGLSMSGTTLNAATGGDASTTVSSTTGDELALFSGTSGKLIKPATGTGIVKVTAGIASTVTAPSGTIVGTSDTQTLTNKTIQPRVVTVSDATSITPNVDTTDICKQINTQSAGTLTLNNPTGTPYDGQRLQVIIDSTNIHTVSMGTAYRGSTDLAITGISTSGSGKTDYLLFQYHGTDAKWDYLAKNFGF